MQDQNQGGQQLLQQEMRYNQQPTTSVTNVIVTQPEPASNPLMLTGLQGHRKWTTGLFGCFDDIPMCLLTLCCLPFVECKNASRLEECCCIPYCVPGGTIIVRARLRTIGGIQGSVCNDCMTLACCGPCAVCQMSREMDNMGIL
ncbi:cornifelin homolog A-like isoform X1 [Mizuhopecten yessoensis]|uniref:cornifelin homolog A-like isoform X1 n=1 Tax=Mizuhopecten yessoensis TaxID=6573 RepID=UPI000B45C243|nr:cornifelin homolog A-like isoform X1 [Mizuhopecten yessoensis]